MPYATKEQRNIARKRRKRGPLGDLELQLEDIIRLNDKDRVAAIRQLVEIRTMGGLLSGAPAPNNITAMTDALARMLKSAGRDLTDQALAIAFPEANAKAPDSPHMEGPPDSGGGLD